MNSALIREHEAGHPLPGGGTRCVHCGCPMGTQYTYTCLSRANPGGALMPEPARREYASESWDAIGGRLAELRAERDAATNAVATEAVPVSDEMDWLCG